MSDQKYNSLLNLIYETLDNKKAHDIHVLDISRITIFADYFVITSGSNQNQIHAMADAVEEKLAAQGIHPRSVEGYQNANWILMDYRDIVIHIFDTESREFYDLERIWRDAETVTIEA